MLWWNAKKGPTVQDYCTLLLDWVRSQNADAQRMSAELNYLKETSISCLLNITINSFKFYLFINLNYWGDIGSQNQTRFKYTTQKTSSAHCIGHRWSQAKSLSICIFTPFAHMYLVPTPLSLWLLPHCCLCLCACMCVYSYIYIYMYVCVCSFLAYPFTFFHEVLPTLFPSSHSVPCIHACFYLVHHFILLIRLISPWKWNHMVFVFFWLLISHSIYSPGSSMLSQKVKFPSF